MASVLIFTCFMLSSLSLVCGNVPVLMWESSKSDRITKFSAMSTVSHDDFKEYLSKKVHGEIKNPLIVMYKENSLSVEDFTMNPYPTLKYIAENSRNSEFLSSVSNPIGAVEQLTKAGYTLHYVNVNNNYELPDGCGKVIIVKLEEAKPEEGRLELLRKHDKTMAEIYSQLLSKCSHVIGITSGLQSSWNDVGVYRVRRSVDDGQNDTSESYTIYQDEPKNVLMVTKSIPTMVLNGETKPLLSNPAKTVPNVSGDRSKANHITLVLNFRPMELKFNFDNLTSGYWYLRSLAIGGNAENETLILKPNKEIYAPLDMSYHSGSPVIFKNGTTTLTFKNLQVQPFFIKPGSTIFSDAVDDVMFFTPPIWSGIFVTFLLAIIFSWGISMIMDIHTMDQFDDPKGKTITVSATD